METEQIVHRRASTSRRRTLSWLFASLAAVVCLLAVVTLGTRFWVHRTIVHALPQIDGQLAVSGLRAPAQVTRNEHGIPSIQAQSLDDLVFAQGYVTAQDRLWQMDMLRRHAAGELAEVLGPSMLEHDRTQRYLQLRATADRDVPRLAPRKQRLLQRYAEGVNAFITANADRLPVEFRLLRYTPRLWQPRDTLLIAFAMAEDLSTSYPQKLNREAVAARLSPEQVADLYPVGSWRDHPPTDGKPDLTAPREMIDIPLDESQAGLTTMEHTGDLIAANRVLAYGISAMRCPECASGSNNWAVSGARSASGKPLIANDMHLALTIPGIWYTVNLQAGDFRMGGVALPGVPLVVVGHNAHVAWAFTNTAADVQDLYIEQVSGDSYRAIDSSMQALQHHAEVIHVKGQADVSLDIRLTQHGDAATPLLTPLFPHETRQLALRWTLFEPNFADMPFADVGRASTGAEVVDALKDFNGPSQNLVYADDSGHIGYHATGLVPLRGDGGHSGISPVTVDAGSYEWTGFIPYDQLPHVEDPPGGIVATANARITPDSYPYTVALDWEPPYRNERIWNVLGDGKNLTPSSMTSLQLDDFSALDKLIAERTAYAVDHATGPSKRARQAADILRAWDGHVDASSPAPAITQAVRVELMAMMLAPVLGNTAELYTWHSRAYALELILEHEPARWLPTGYATWNDFITAALEHATDAKNVPRNLGEWKWGKIHELDLDHPIFSRAFYLKWLAGRVGTGNAELPGNAFTVRALSGVHGSSQRFVADLASPASASMTLPAGESGNTASTWFVDQWPSYVQGLPIALPYEASAQSGHTLTLVPLR